MEAKSLLSKCNKFWVLEGNREKAKHTEHKTEKWQDIQNEQTLEMWPL